MLHNCVLGGVLEERPMQSLGASLDCTGIINMYQQYNMSAPDHNIQHFSIFTIFHCSL